jgi:hypothetical protein
VSETGVDPEKVAETEVLEEIVKVHEPVPEQELPDQPEKVEPDEGVAERVTEVPEGNEAEQTLPQLMELPEMVPVPVPDFETVR